MDLGFMVSGLFVAQDEVTYKDGRTVASVTLAVGNEAIKVFMKDGYRKSMLEGVENCRFGTPLRITCRPYVSKKGGVGYGNGEICDID